MSRELENLSNTIPAQDFEKTRALVGVIRAPSLVGASVL